MQILPTAADAAAVTDALWTAQNAGRSVGGFAEYLETMHTAMNNAENGDSVSADADLAQEAASTAPAATRSAATQVQSPYTRTTSNGVTYTLEEVCFTKQELQSLRQKLAKAGVPADSLERLDALAAQPDGASLAMVLASLKSGTGTPQLSDDEKSDITSLLKKIDPTGVLDSSVQALMLQGKGEEALALVQDFVAKLDPTAALEVGRDEAMALGKGLGLSSSALLNLSNQFGGATALMATPGQLANLLTPATDHFTAAKAAQKTLDTALKDTLQPMLATARARTEKEKQAHALQNKKVQQSKTVIDDTVQQKSREVLSQTMASAAEDNAATAKTAHTSTQTTAQTAPRTQNARQTDAAHQSADSAALRNHTAQAQGAASQNGQEAATGEDGHAASDKKSSKESAWDDLLQTVAVKTTPAATTARADAAAQAALYAAQNTTGEPVSAASANAQPQLARQVAGQVERGLLSSLQNGGTRLDLQLHPQELGAITLSLTVRNGEVSALIRPEKSETADMVNRQVEHIRLNLEQQGLKVDKVEVQLDARQQDDAAWQNLEQHNSRQEEDARREELARLKNLATARNIRESSTDTALEQPVHSLHRTAGYAAGALNVVA